MLPVLKKIFSQNLILPFRKGNRFVFIYHYIRPDHDPVYLELCTTTYSVFVRQIDFLRQNFQIVDLDTLLHADLPPDKNYAALTFDDGFSTVRTLALPLLERYQLPFTVFLNQFAIENDQLWVSNVLLNKHDENYLKMIWGKLLQEKITYAHFQTDPIQHLIEQANWNEDAVETLHTTKPITSLYMKKEDVLFLAQKGVKFGNHTVKHLPLAYCNEVIQKQEIEKNQYFLENLIDQSIPHFAIPFGKKNHFDASTIRICRKIGISSVYSTNPNQFSKINRNPFPETGEGVSIIPRIAFTEENPQQVCFYVNRSFFRTYNL